MLTLRNCVQSGIGGILWRPTVAKIGRKLNLEEIFEEFIGLVAKGHYYDTACRIVGISRTCFYRYMQYGAIDKDECSIRPDGERVYPDGILFNPRFQDFRRQVEYAAASAEAETVDIVRTPQQDLRTGLTDMNPLMWWLERRFPHKYGRRVMVDDAEAVIHTGNDVITPDQMEKIGLATIEQAKTMRRLAALADEQS